jgi:hypothetical protein
LTQYSGASFNKESNSPLIYSGLLQSSGYYSAPSDVYFSGDFTITAFVKVISTQNWARILDFGNYDGSYNNDNIILALSWYSSGQPIVQLYDGIYYDAMNNPSSVTLSNYTWTHVAGILQGNNISIYLNCILTHSETVTFLPQNVVRMNNYIGRSNWIFDSYANAKFRNVRIYNRALSQSELITDFNNQ